MNIVEALGDYIENEGFATFDVDMFIGGASLDMPDDCIWLLSGGGNVTDKNISSGKFKTYVMPIFVRGTVQKDVYDKAQALEELINDYECTDLDGYDTIELEATSFPIDEDLDGENRVVGVVEVTATIYRQ